jgi:alkanesulfonate monooxygenase SsuD/methylene tetrahydromethanopterin reductase-like flavin-dependent oxidoreductase (luciferase family)
METRGALMSHPLRFGIGTGNRKPMPELIRNWQMIENLGWDTAWVVDHFMAGDDEDIPYYEAWTLIATLGMVTSRIRFGIMVSGNTYRNPGLLAKQALTIDHASNGRVELGLGAGWMEREHVAYSYPFPPVKERVDMFEEALVVVRSLMTEYRTNYQGDYYQFVDAPFEPKPLQKPHIPIVTGAMGKRTISISGRHADMWNTRSDPETSKEQVGWLRSAAEKVGRNPDDIRMSVFTWTPPFETADHLREMIQPYRELGFTDFIFPMPPEEQWDMMERVSREVIPQLRREG